MGMRGDEAGRQAGRQAAAAAAAREHFLDVGNGSRKYMPPMIGERSCHIG